MSSYAREMERDFSAQSLSSRGGSEVGSRYTVESGFYMTSFAATIFIGGIIISGVLLITLLIALTVMLQSCESKSSGLVGFSFSDLKHCEIYALHAELNSLEVDGFPSICKDVAIRYIKQGHYSRDLDFIMRVAEEYFYNSMLLDDGLDVVLIDIDDIVPSISHSESLLFDRIDRLGCNDFDEKVKSLRRALILRMFLELRSIGWPLILLSRKLEKQRNATIEYLRSAGYGGWSSLIMRFDDELKMDNYEYFSKRRAKIQEQGFRIKGIISSQMDALTGPILGERVFKLPSPIYCNSNPSHTDKIMKEARNASVWHVL